MTFEERIEYQQCGNMTRKQNDADAIAKMRILLAGVGLRATAARLAVIRWLQTAKSPATHADIAEDLVLLGFDKATVFRNLTDLAEAGLVTRTELGDHVWRFELRDSSHSNGELHPHFVCIDCGSVSCVHDDKLLKEARKVMTSLGQVTEILLRGHCTSCQ